MRSGILAADMDAERQEGQGMAVRETLPEERRGGMQERQPLREGFGESIPDGMERHCGEQGKFSACMEKTDNRGERLGEMAGGADDGADSPAAA